VDFDRKKHWEEAWSSKVATEASWYQSEPRLSLSLIANCSPEPDTWMIDIGGGASLLVDHLLDAGFKNLTVLDISAAALDQAKHRLGHRSGQVAWIEADITQAKPGGNFDIWHDRAAFHFLTAADDRALYVSVLKRSLVPGGHAIIAAFAPGGPQKCSGLDIVQYDAEKLAGELGPGFVLVEKVQERHITPAKREQLFGFYRFQRRAM
jgi:trans-aconitate methyltransferase